MENKIICTVNGTVISPYLVGQCKPLEKMCSRYDSVYHKHIFTIGFPAEDEGIFLTHSLSMSFLKQHFPDYKIEFKTPSFYQFDSVDCKPGILLRDNQKNVMFKLENCESKEIFLNVPTAVGKTFMGVIYSTFLQTKTLIMCKSVVILDQWEEAIDTITVGGKQRVYRVKGSGDILKILNGKVNCYNYDFFLMTPAVITSFAKKYSWKEFSEAIKIAKISLNIVDEAHLNIGATVRLNASTCVYKTLYLSADDTRGNTDAKNAFNSVFHNTVFIRMDDEELQQLKHIIAVFLTFDSKPDAGDIQQIQGGPYNWSYLEYSKYEFRKQITQSKTIFIINEILEATNNRPYYKILILLQTIDQIETLGDELAEIYKGKLTVGKFHSKMTKEDKITARKCNVIVSTYGSFSVGVNEVNPEIRYVISTIPVDEVSTNQAGGRCRPIEGMYSWLYMLYDTGFGYCENKIRRVASYLTRSKIKDIYRRDLGPVDSKVRIDQFEDI